MTGALPFLYPPLTGLEIPVMYFEHREPQHTVSAGGSTQLRYDLTLKKKTSVGLLGGFQVDSNGDNITQVGLSLGRRF